MTEISELSQIIAQINDPQKVEKFLTEMLTPNERKDLVLRWNLMKMLKAGVPQRKISSDLGISLCKITRGSKILKSGDSMTGEILLNEE